MDSTDVLPLSVVIATYNRAGLLRNTLAALTGQTLETTAFEVIIVDDGSTDNTRAVVHEFEGLLNLKYTFQHNAGLASARNHGTYLSKGWIVFFLDDDDIPSPTLLEEHLKTHREYPEPHYAVLGYTAIHPDIQSDPLMHYVTEVGCLLFSYPHLTQNAILDFTYFWGGRSSCKRAFMLEHGVFNHVFRFGYEDIELGYRLSRQGFRVIYNAEAQSTMLRKISFADFCKRCVRQGESAYTFSKLHDDPVIAQYTGVSAVVGQNHPLLVNYEQLIQKAGELDEMVNLGPTIGMDMSHLTDVLHQAYLYAFTASKFKGIQDAYLRETNAG